MTCHPARWSILALALVSTGCLTTTADHGRYTTTTVRAPDSDVFRLPRDRTIVLAAGPANYPCAHDSLVRRLASLAVRITAPSTPIERETLRQHQSDERAAAESTEPLLDDALVLMITVDSLWGPAGSWQPLATMDLKSAHRRSDAGLAIYDGRRRAVAWTTQVRSRRVLNCADSELLTLLQQLLVRIE